MKDLHTAKEVYESIKVPEKLEARLETAFLTGKAKWKRRRIRKKIVQSCICCFTLVCVAFVTLVNTNAVFADSVSSVPILGSLAKVCTFVEFEEEDESSYIHVRIPELKDTGNTELEATINQKIRTTMDELLQDARDEAKANWEAYLDTGGDPADYVPMEVCVDYEVKPTPEGKLSFMVWISWVRANYYRECAYYNYDLRTGREITLEDLLGVDWKEKAYSVILSEMKEREKEKGGELYFRLDTGEYSFTELPEHPDFYINAKGNPVIVFGKYEIGYGYIGEQEFEVPVS